MNEKQPEVFTPNIEREEPQAGRYSLYRHAHNKFSIGLEGEIFSGKVERAPCGLGCYCGGFLTPDTERGRELLGMADTIL